MLDSLGLPPVERADARARRERSARRCCGRARSRSPSAATSTPAACRRPLLPSSGDAIGAACSCGSTAAAGCSATSTATTTSAARSPTAAGSACSASATGWRPSTPSRPRSTTPSPPLAWACDHAAELGCDPIVAVGGDSAGGNLAAVVCQPARRARLLPAPRLPGDRRPDGQRTRPSRRTPTATSSRRRRCAGSTTTTCRVATDAGRPRGVTAAGGRRPVGADAAGARDHRRVRPAPRRGHRLRRTARRRRRAPPPTSTSPARSTGSSRCSALLDDARSARRSPPKPCTRAFDCGRVNQLARQPGRTRRRASAR